MRHIFGHNGSAYLLVVFIVALVAAVVMGMLQINTEEIQIMQNQVQATEALCIAEAGLNDALAQIRVDVGWNTGFTNKAFSDGSYTVTVGGVLPNRTIISTGTTSQGFVGRLQADVIVGLMSPHTINIDAFRINMEE